MSTYEYTNKDKDTLGIRPSLAGPGEILLSVQVGSAFRGIHIPNADAPTVAAELLKAAGIEATILPKTTEAVEVRGDGWIVCGGDEGYSADLLDTDPELIRQRAANCIALAEYIEAAAAREAAEKAEAEAAEKKLQERRDELAYAFLPSRDGYSSLPDPVKAVIEYVIDLEDTLAAK